MDTGINTMAPAAPQSSPTEQAIQQIDRNLSDLIDEITALEQTIRPSLTPEDNEIEKVGTTPTGDRVPVSVLAREMFSIGDRIRFQTERLNALKRRVEL